MPTKHPQFAAFITKHRKQRGLSMAALADAVGVTKSNVHYWESGEGLPNANVLQPLAEVLEVSYEDLFALAGYASPQGLPGPAPYLRAKYPDAPKKALAEAEKFFAEFNEKYGEESRDAD